MACRVGISPERGQIPQYLNQDNREGPVTVTEVRKGPGVVREGCGYRHTDRDRDRPSQGSR